MPFLELLLRATAWSSLLAWAASEWLRSTAPAGSAGEGRARLLLTAGLFSLLAHSALAFHARYDWSHEAAARETARQTEAVMGLAFGGGLLVNYLFLLLWSLDVLWWWRAPVGYRGRRGAIEWSVRAFFALMFVNGAIVFARGPVRLVGIVASLAAAWAWYRGSTSEVVHG